nr:lysine--trna ligase, mitochondrial [Quercus suber]
MLVNPGAIRVMRVAHLIDDELRKFFLDEGFTGVRTPLLTAGAGGATARPFETVATELENEVLNLRIAPELFLKRLVVGGMAKVYEIGPVFRNEGVDATHNPEFTICEFYEAFSTLEHLMERTENLLDLLSSRIQKDVPNAEGTTMMSQPLDLRQAKRFARIEFIPALEAALDQALPNLSSPDEAQASILDIFMAKNIPIPAKPTLPRLLDSLAGYYLEPLCRAPTFIIHHPAALSPLSKHFVCPLTGQVVAARAELFINCYEYANMYEEENSPFEQRRKFEEQLKYRQVDGESDGRSEVDESYLEALEWGLPPTGGWGCGVDRLVMLFAAQERIADVLTFGSLRNVVGLGKRWS